MIQRWTKEDLVDKVDWEGGLFEAIVNYGIPLDVLPTDTPSDVMTAWEQFFALAPAQDTIRRWLYS